jgi:hypothetical protein
MDAPLQDCTIEERSIVRFVWAEGAKPVEIHRRMLAQYGQSAKQLPHLRSSERGVMRSQIHFR